MSKKILREIYDNEKIRLIGIRLDGLTDKKIKRNYVSVTILHKEKLYFKN